jgi:CDP-diacylglycerol--serine O-phosphatidyltransferase
MLKNIKLPDYVSFLNAMFGLLSIVFSTKREFGLATLFLFCSVFFDLLDGKIAKLVKRKDSFGKELDSLADIISFGVAPVIFGFNYLDINLINIVILFIFLFAGMIRLAFFNITEMNGYYYGLPVTNSGWVIPFFYLINLPKNLFIYIYLLLAILYISPFKLKKVF